MDTQTQAQPQQPTEVKQTQPTAQPTTSSSLNYAGIGTRAGALIIDTIITMIASGILTGVLRDSNISSLVIMLVTIGYFIGMEAYNNGQTIGKIALGIKVVGVNGQQITVQQSLIRNLLRIVDSLPVFYIVGIIIASGSPTKQRFGDKIANTVVVKK